MSTLNEQREESKQRAEQARERALNGTATYTKVVDASYVTHLKLDGYGFIGHEHGGVRRVVNLGVELPARVIEAAWDKALSERDRDEQRIWDAAANPNYTGAQVNAMRDAHVAKYGRRS